MDEGLLFWLIVIAVVVLQGIGQRKKKPGQQPGEPGGRTAPRQGRVESPDRIGIPQDHTAAPPDRHRAAGRAESSEGMIPSDVWEEILGLARGQPQAKRKAAPRAEDRAAEEVEGYEEGRSYDEEGRAHEGDSGYAAEPASTADSTPAPGPPPLLRTAQALRPTPSSVPVSTSSRSAMPVSRPFPGTREAGATERLSVREDLFGSGSPEDLRKAIILREVLGPPLALRED